ncbi:hypothetical protein [Paenibacillus humicus]|uniref:hypothetical protein n=1 Tax=Paenibacillus humicus TaxID=412861 RepID=UPI0013E35817|nr:hypothetical protein [Paenibacillus humicus]
MIIAWTAFVILAIIDFFALIAVAATIAKDIEYAAKATWIVFFITLLAAIPAQYIWG